VCEWKWMKLYDLYIDSQLNAEKYTAWFKIALPQVMKQFKLQLV
jgi:hypothetical protein